MSAVASGRDLTAEQEQILAHLSPKDRDFVLWMYRRVMAMTPKELAAYGITTAETT